MAIKIDRIDAGSDAETLGLQPGDELLSVDENELNDTLDYDFYTDSSSFHLKAKVADGIREWDVRRAERGPFGCDFSTYLGDQKHSCSNHCMFCFIDQLPPGMRESLYFKDDDERLSFLFGNYITMTNMQDHEIDRIIKMHISPINISVHTTNPQLRVRMLANKRGGEVLKYLPRLVEGGIAVAETFIGWEHYIVDIIVYHLLHVLFLKIRKRGFEVLRKKLLKICAKGHCAAAFIRVDV